MKASEFFSMCEIANNCLFLPDRESAELDPKFYTKNVRQPLLDLGGEWMSDGSYFKFPFDPTDRVRELIEGKKTKLSSKFHFFETPLELAANMFMFCQEAGIPYYKLLDLKTAKCLEPSAGRGSLVRRLYIERFKNVSYYENMPENREIMRQFDYYGNKPQYLGEDFMKGTESGFDLVLANPPFRNEEKHIAQMFKVCKPDGIVLTLSSPKLYHSDKFEAFLNANSSKWMMRELESSKDYPIFEGTNIGCTLIAAQVKKDTLF